MIFHVASPCQLSVAIIRSGATPLVQFDVDLLVRVPVHTWCTSVFAIFLLLKRHVFFRFLATSRVFLKPWPIYNRDKMFVPKIFVGFSRPPRRKKNTKRNKTRSTELDRFWGSLSSRFSSCHWRSGESSRVIALIYRWNFPNCWRVL